MIGFVFRAVIAALGLWLATRWVDGILIDDATTLVLAGLLLGIVNAIVRPVMVVLTFPFTLVTLGLFLLVVNAAMLGLVALFLPGFSIDGFWSALLAALIVSITGWIGSWFIGSRGKVEVYKGRAS
ncbi:MAG TPA: phage holin family protein [Steroidobacteraceae bacterium]|nr:phage holin family protein [Steroidobacteraceae bacterium]